VLQEYQDVDGAKATSENIVEASFKGDDAFMNSLLLRLIHSNIPVVAFNQLSGSLEDIFMMVTATEENK
jgi:hypothetical protein